MRQSLSMKLVDGWQEAWKWISVNCMLAATALQGAWMYIPDDLRAEVPKDIIHFVTIGLLVLGVAGRMVKQG